MTTTDDIMALAEAYGLALLDHGICDFEYDAIRTAIESLVAERETVRADCDGGTCGLGGYCAKCKKAGGGCEMNP